MKKNLTTAITPGVNLIGFFHAGFGLGESCRLTSRALDAARIPYAKISTEGLFGHLKHTIPKTTYSDPAIYPINLLCIGQGNIIPYFCGAFNRILSNHYNIAVWFWETNYLPPKILKELDYLDEIWVTSRYMEEYLKSQVSVPIRYLPQTVHHPEKSQNISKHDFNLSDSFMFLFCFDYNSVEKRKNPGALIEAFLQAFPDNPNVQLVIKSQNANGRQSNLPYYEKVEKDQRIKWIDESTSRQKLCDLISVCDCYVSLHRSEGFGLTMAEAMCFEKPVIGTGFSGNLDFMNDENSYLCSYKLISIGKGAQFYPEKGIWADPDVNHAASLMQEVFNQPIKAKEKGLKGKIYIAANHSEAYCGKRILENLVLVEPSKQKKHSYSFLTKHLFRYTKFQTKQMVKCLLGQFILRQ